MNDNAKLDSKISRLFTDILWLRFTLDSLAFNGIYRLFSKRGKYFYDRQVNFPLQQRVILFEIFLLPIFNWYLSFDVLANLFLY